uniref:Uncharacterized protein n=1 Tax=viral metagenome TaxID=1070528 RepID=A0A6C0BHW6_9ZZZZ
MALARRPWTDGLNSFWHFTFGLLAVKFPLIIILFVAYQSLDIYEKNYLVDLFEFFFGFLISLIIFSYTNPKHRNF